MEVQVSLLASATAGAVSKIAFHPIDTAKSQVQAGKNSSAWKAFMDTYRTNGLKGLYRGIGAVLVGGTPAVMIYLTTYEITKNKFDSINYPLPEFVKHFSAGMFAEACSCSIFVPVDVIKERLQVYQTLSVTKSSYSDKGMIYKNSWDSLKQIMKHEGLLGIYKGYGATLMSFGPFSAFYFAFYEQAKVTAGQILKKDSKDLNFIETLFTSLAAGTLSAYITTPLDLVKLRMQIQRGQGGINEGMTSMLKNIFMNEGTSGLFRGSVARIGAYAPGAAMTMAIFESCKDFWSSVISLI